MCVFCCMASPGFWFHRDTKRKHPILGSPPKQMTDPHTVSLLWLFFYDPRVENWFGFLWFPLPIGALEHQTLVASNAPVCSSQGGVGGHPELLCFSAGFSKGSVGKRQTSKKNKQGRKEGKREGRKAGSKQASKQKETTILGVPRNKNKLINECPMGECLRNPTISRGSSNVLP